EVYPLAGGEGLAEEVDDRDARDDLGVLEGEEESGPAPVCGRPVGDVVALEEDRPGGDLVLGAAEQGAGQGRLAGPVGAHERVDLAGVHHEIDATEDLGAVCGNMEVTDLEDRGAGHGRQCISTTAIVVISPDRKSTRLNSSHVKISYAVFCLKKKKKTEGSI